MVADPSGFPAHGEFLPTARRDEKAPPLIENTGYKSFLIDARWIGRNRDP
jgi:hypothetical protein